MNGGQRRLACELHCDGDDVVADRNIGEADRRVRILYPGRIVIRFPWLANSIA